VLNLVKILRIDISSNYNLNVSKSVAALTHHCHHLKHLNIRSYKNIHHEALTQLIKHGKHLEYLNLMETRIDNLIKCKELTTLGNYCPHLKFLNLISINGYTTTTCGDIDVIVRNVIQSCHKLEQLYIDEGISPATVAAITKNPPKLTHLHLGVAELIKDSDIVILSKLFPLLKLFSIVNNKGITDTGIIEVAKQWPKLTYLNINGCYEITDTGIQELAQNNHFIELQFLFVSDIPKITSKSIDCVIEKCTNIKLLVCPKKTMAEVSSNSKTLIQKLNINTITDAIVNSCILNGSELTWTK